MHIQSNTELVARLVIAQACTVARLHEGNAAQCPQRMNLAIVQLNELEALRTRFMPYIPSLSKLNGWHCALYTEETDRL